MLCKIQDTSGGDGGSARGSSRKKRDGAKGPEVEGTERGVGAPPAYAELSSHFGVLEKAAEDSGNGDGAFHLQWAKLAMIAAHASKPARQADMRDFVERV